MLTPPDISIVIPAINEQDTIAACVASAIHAGATEIIVSDGGSDDETAFRASQAGASHVIRSIPGRGIQMNCGSTFASGEVVMFLHADNRLAPATLSQVCELTGDWVWGAAGQRIDDPGFGFRLLEFGNAQRVRWRAMPFGDQAIFVRRDVFKQVGGFDEGPLMEDVELSRKLRKIAKPRLIEGPVTVNPRRWKKHGLVKQTLLNWRIQIAHKLGVAPETLVTWYR